MSRGDNKTFRLLRKMLRIPSSIEEFVNTEYNPLINEINFMLERISLTRNFQSEIAENVDIPASSTIKVYHRLSVIPKYRIVLRQSGGGLITDGNFTDKYIELTNNGGSTATISVAILKE